MIILGVLSPFGQGVSAIGYSNRLKDAGRARGKETAIGYWLHGYRIMYCDHRTQYVADLQSAVFTRAQNSGWGWLDLVVVLRFSVCKAFRQRYRLGSGRYRPARSVATNMEKAIVTL